MEIQDWSNSAMVKRHQHLTKMIRRDMAKQVDGLIWKPEKRKKASQGQESAAAGTARRWAGSGRT